MLDAAGDRLIDARDRALLAFGMASAMRRSELVALDVADLTETPDGLHVLIRRSKTDQEGAGQVIAVPLVAKLARSSYCDPAGAVIGERLIRDLPT
jgi:integrase